MGRQAPDRLDVMSWTPRSGVYMDEHYNLVYPEGSSLLDGVDSDLLEVIDSHWQQFPPQHPLINHLVGLSYFILWIINVLGNGSVIFIFMKVKSLRTPSNMFVVNLALSDFCMMLTQAWPVIINAFTQRYWMWGKLGCQLYGATGAITGVCSILTMVAIGYDRYNVIVKGLSGTKITSGVAFLILLLIWAYSVGVCCGPFFGWGAYKVEGTLISCSYDFIAPDWNSKSFILFAYIANYFTPLAMIAYFYSHIVRAVVVHEKTLKEQAKKMNVDRLRAGGDKEESNEFKIAKVAVTNVLLWFCIWTPYATVSSFPSLGAAHLLTPVVAAVPGFAAKLASCLNPLVYAVSHPKFREAMAQELPCCGIGVKRKEEDCNTVSLITA